MSTALRRRIGLLLAFAFSQFVVFVMLAMPEVPGGGSWLKAFRAAFSFDQLSYAAIAASTASGSSGLTEPFTETGNSYYPSLWYRILGWLAALTGASVPTVWTLATWAILAGAVAFIGWIGYRISTRAWAPALVGPALLVGTLSVVLHNNWYTTLASHAVLWGPYGGIYVLNAEVAGFACVGSALAIGLRVLLGPAQRVWVQAAWVGFAALLLGVTANIQTYIFFVGAGVAFSWLGAYGLLRSRSRALLWSSAALLVFTLALGSFIAGRVGALPVYALFIACTLPGVGWLVVKHLKALALPALIFVLAALPQALVVIGGILAKDPFLTYRQDQSADLGVPLFAGFLATLPIAGVWAFNLAVQRNSRNTVVLAALSGLAFSGVMLTFNNVWGFGQEPYRLWIDSVTITALMLAPLTAWSIARVHAADLSLRSGPVAITAWVAIVIFAVSLLDFGAFRTWIATSGVIRFDTDRAAKIATLTESADGLLSSGPCLDPAELKIITGKPVAYYNLGMAWPADKAGIDGVVDAWRAGTFNPDALHAAKVNYLITDSNCPNPWPVDGTMGFANIGAQNYADEAGSGTLTLWLVG